MPRKPRLLALTAALLAGCAALAWPALALPAAPPIDEVGAGGAWSYFSDPRSVHVAGIRCSCTYTGWVNARGDIVLGALDEQAHTLQLAVLMPGAQVNDHANPSLLALPDNRIAVFWTTHQGRHLWERVMTRPEDVRSFGPLQTISARVSGDTFYTYTNPVLVPAEHNRIYLFWRSQYTHQAFATSDDLGRSWSAARVLLDEPHQRPYVKYDVAPTGSVLMAFTKAHPDSEPTPVYFLSYQGGRFRRADGTVVATMADLPLRPELGSVVGVTGAAAADAWALDVAQGADGNPVVVYVTAGAGEATHYFHYARWDGRKWLDAEVAAAGGSIDQTGREPSYTGGVTLDHADPNVMFLSRPNNGVHQVERWVATAGTVNFTSAVIAQDATHDNLRPVVPRGLPADTSEALWMTGTYRHFTDFSTSIVASVPVMPPQAQSTQLQVSLGRSRAGASLSGQLVLAANGNAAPGAEVWLFSREPGAAKWVRGPSLRTDGLGQVRFALPRDTDTQYTLEWPGDDRWAASSSSSVTIGG